jgi:hypothetical protein
MSTPPWIKIGQHDERDVLEEIVRKLREKWVNRYEFNIAPVTDDKTEMYELRLKHL